jgi:hypothetical protein
MRTALAVGLMVAALAVAAPVPAVDVLHRDPAAKISTAKSAKDHEALAADYAKQAAEARAEAERHDKMGASYKGAEREKLHLEDHCKAIANNYRETAKALDALAEGERQLAKEAK